MNISINFRAYFSMLFRNFWLLLAAFAIAFGYSWVAIEQPKKPIYTAQSTMYVTSGKQENWVQYSTSYQFAAQALIETCSVVIKSDRSVELMRQQLVEEYPEITANEIRSAITVGSVNETEVMSITATSADKEKAIDIANAALEVVPSILKDVVKVGEANPLDTASYATSSNYPSLRGPILFGGVALVLVAGLLFVIVFLDTRIKDEEELSREFGLTVIGEVPNFTRPVGGKYSYYRYAYKSKYSYNYQDKKGE